MKMKRFLIFIICFVSQSALAGTTGKISGIVTDSRSGEPLAGVNVLIEGLTMGAATDPNGFYYIINIPPGEYTLEATYIGYQTTKQTNIIVQTDLTTKINFVLVEAAIEGETIEIVAKRPPIQKDLTASEQGYNSDEIEAAPVEALADLIQLQTGIIPLGNEASGYVAGSPGDGLHIRGGRENETLFLIDGVKVGDDIYGGSRYIQNTSGGAIEEMKTIIGTFNAEYGGKTGAIISVVTKDAPKTFSGSLSGYTDNFGIADLDRNTLQGEFSLTGPLIGGLSFFTNFQSRTTDGRPDIFGVSIPEWRDSNGLVGRIDDDDVPDGWKVPLDWRDEWNGMAKLIYRPAVNMKILASYFHSRAKRSDYKHTYRYLPYSQPWVDTENINAMLKFVHTLSPSTFYEVMGSFQNTNFFYGIDKTRERKILYGQRITHEDYYVSGAVHDYNTDSSWTWQAFFNLTSQLDNIHQLKTGLELRRIEVFHRMDNAGGAPVQDIDGEIYETHMAYVRRNPIEGAFYIQDKMEFEDLGMILNLGLRIELWNPEMEFMEEPEEPLSTEMIKTERKIRLSPRFGISYPISQAAAFHFAYGHFYQLPRYMELVSGLNDRGYFAGRPNLNDPGPGISNPNAKPEKTVSYETGVQLNFAQDVNMNVTAFYREMSDLMGVRWISGGGGYIYLDNVDFGYSKGVEILLHKRLSSMWSVRLNYTWSSVNISTSSPLTAAQKNRFISYRTFLADWDRPHNFSANLLVTDPASWGISVIFNVLSGRPYSVLAEQLNTERMPPESYTDLQLSKYFFLWGVQESIYLRITNLFDIRNVLSVYSETGKWDIDYGKPRHLTANPKRISDGRAARIGIKISF
jgi:hypothetical protein